MAAPRYPSRRFRTGWRGPSIVECVLALSVIAGLMFVTVRIMNGGLPASLTRTTETGTVVVKTDASPLASGTPDTKTP